MRAIVLVGGEGTRLRPLTLDRPKALVPVAGRPLVGHQLAHLRRHGLTSVTFALTRPNAAIEALLGDGSGEGLSLTYVYEDDPLGSGGAIRQAGLGWDEPFLVINGDLITDLDLRAMQAAHREAGAAVTIALYAADDPSRFGVAELGPGDGIRRFVEKPAAGRAPSNWVNAGAWIFSPEATRELPVGASRVEDDLFPRLAARPGGLQGFRHGGYWIDVGTLPDYYRANVDALRAGGAPAVQRAADVTVADDALIEAPSALGAGSVVEAGATVRASVLWEGVRVGAGAVVDRSILARGASVGPGARLVGGVVAAGETMETGQRPSATI